MHGHFKCSHGFGNIEPRRTGKPLEGNSAVGADDVNAVRECRVSVGYPVVNLVKDSWEGDL